MVRSYLFDEAKARQEVDVGTALDSLSDRQLLWIDVEGVEEGAELAELLGLRERTVRRLSEEAARPALEDFEEYFHLDVVAVHPGATSVDVIRVHCLVGQNWVLTLHAERLELLDAFGERVSGAGELGSIDAPSFLATLLEWLLGSYYEALEHVESELERLDARLIRARFKSQDEGLLDELVGVRRYVAGIRRALAPNRAVFASLVRPEFDRISTSDSARRFSDLVDRLEQTLDAIRTAREMVLGSVDLLIARTGQRTNDIMKVLTLASIMLLPSSLLAGVLGMNFKQGFFENPGGFWIAVGAMALLAGVTLATARLRRWI
jgi:magnesium/cobalt transport protein CorA